MTTNTEHLSQILSRVVDRAERGDDWDVLVGAQASVRPELWGELAELLRDEGRLREAGEERIAAAAAVPLSGSAAAAPRFRPSPQSLVAAAALLLAWFLYSSSGDAVQPNGQLASEEPVTTHAGPERIGELVPMVMERRVVGDGGAHELILLRQIVEREIVPALYEVGVDENDLPLTRPVQDAGPSGDSYL